ncbi:hypothetical protein NMY22_g16522 [Coprinellus aureogranulatus]|nr:hypothetical protein NMY22_g16522 [Coprinellus aureogranulatus]
MESLGNPLQKLNEANLAKPLGDFAEPLKKFSEEPVEKTKRAAVATQNVVQSTFDPTYKPHSVAAQKIVLAKGFFDVFLSLSLIFFPSLLYDGPIPKALSFVTGLSKASWEADTNAAFALSSLIMGCGFAGIVAGESTSDDAYKVVAALNGIFALMALTGSILHPHKFGSSFLFIAGLQDVFWFTAIVKAGGFDVLETLGIPWKRVKKEADNMAGKAAKSLYRRVGKPTTHKVSHEFAADSHRPEQVLPLQIALQHSPARCREFSLLSSSTLSSNWSSAQPSPSSASEAQFSLLQVQPRSADSLQESFVFPETVVQNQPSTLLSPPLSPREPVVATETRSQDYPPLPPSPTSSQSSPVSSQSSPSVSPSLLPQPVPTPPAPVPTQKAPPLRTPKRRVMSGVVVKKFYGVPAKDSQSSKDFLKDVRVWFRSHGMTELEDRLETIADYFGTNSPAEKWLESLTSNQKLTWKTFEKEFEKRFPTEEIVRTREEVDRELLGLELKESDVKAALEGEKPEVWPHIAYANKVLDEG